MIKLSEKCKRLHEILKELPLVKYPFELKSLPLNGIYFFYEEGEYLEHGGSAKRIVRIGTHTGDDNFRNRIEQHLLINENKMNFDKNKLKPSDRSIFRKNIGRTLLNKNNDLYLKIWNKDFITRKNRNEFGGSRNIKKEKSIEEKITEIIRNKFSFRFIIVENKQERAGNKELNIKGLESKLIGTVSECVDCKPSENWLGKDSPIEKIKNSGMWLVQHLGAESITDNDMITIENLIDETKNWIKENDKM